MNTYEQHVIINPSLKPITARSALRGVTDTIDNVMVRIIDKCEFDDTAEVGELRHVDGEYAHQNILSYLELCWAKHFTPVITPDMIWYTLLCEIAIIVKADPERVRGLFSTTDGKQEIIVQTDHAERLPMHLIIDQLKRLVPSDASKYLPTFTTSDEGSQLAFSAAFADAVSPYYNYSMMLCGLPGVVVRGTQGDWELLYRSWNALPAELIPLNDMVPARGRVVGYREMVRLLLLDLTLPDMRAEPSFWREMFHLKMCGSGHQTEAGGWITDLFRTKPEVPYVSNFSSHASRVDYKNITTGKNFALFAGLFSSTLKDGAVLEPCFGSFVVENKKRVEKTQDEKDALTMTMRIVSTPVTGEVKLSGDWKMESQLDVENLNGLGDIDLL